jgi:transposase
MDYGENEWLESTSNGNYITYRRCTVAMQTSNSFRVDPLLEGIAIDGLIADQAFDNNAICKSLAEQGALALIPSKADRKTAIPHDLEMYKWLHLIENDFTKIKAYRRIAPRYDKTDASVEAMIRARSVSSVKKRST